MSIYQLKHTLETQKIEPRTHLILEFNVGALAHQLDYVVRAPVLRRLYQLATLNRRKNTRG